MLSFDRPELGSVNVESCTHNVPGTQPVVREARAAPQAALTATTGYYWPGALYAPRICLAFCRMPLISSIEKRRVNLTF
jgi:hypothetical protein